MVGIGIVFSIPLMESVIKAVPQNLARSIQAGLISSIVLAGVVAIGICAIISYLFSRWLLRPLLAMKRGAEQIASGKYNVRILVRGKDEFAQLSTAFNTMAENLQQSHAILEDLVKARTTALEQANLRLRKADRLKSEFLANMSHELRTPLNSILGFSELLKDPVFGSVTEKQLLYLNNISSSGKHLLALINDILDLAKVDAGKIELHREPLSVIQLLDEIVSNLRSISEKKQIQVSREIAPEITSIYVDHGRFKQIMINLLSNALKFTPANGQITIIAKSEKEFIHISVIDTGIGISHDNIDRIFNEFEQVDGSRTRKFEGTGLGLALSRRLVELHGGEIWVESELEKGTKFTFSIPIPKSNPETPN
jgi:signal transduction histidine kinase